jgi:predicted nucleic acid-binding protein
MKPQAVLVETNWVVDVIAPAHFQKPEAIKLLERAQAGEFHLYVPAICFAEARETIPRRFNPVSQSANLRRFVRWAKAEGRVNAGDAEAAFRAFDKFTGLVENELTKIPTKLDELRNQPNISVFPLSEAMLERQVTIGAMDIALKPYDLAVFAAVLVKAEELRQDGYDWVGFCELDSDSLGTQRAIESQF